MSISQFRDFMENGPGCRIFLAIIMSAIVGSFVLQSYSCQGNNPNGPTAQQMLGEQIAKVAGDAVYANAVEQAADAQKQQMVQQMGSYPPDSEAMNLGNAVFNAVEQRLLVEFAKSKGIKMDDATIKNTADMMFTEQLAEMRNRLIADKKLAPTASDADFQKALKDNYQQDSSQMRTQQNEQLAKILADPAQRINALSYNANINLIKLFEKENAPTDEQLKASYLNRKMKRVWLLASKHPGEDLVKKAEEIRAEITSGKLTFEQAMNKYSNDDPPKGKTVSETTFEPAGTTVQVDPEYKAIQTMKVGDVSPVMSFGDSAVAIFKLLEMKPDLPKDFEANKATYRKTLSTSLASKMMTEELSKLRHGSQVEWLNKGYQVLYEWYAMKYEPSMMPKGAEKVKVLQDLADKAKAAMDAAGSSPRAAAFAWFSTTTDLWRSASAEQKKALVEDRIASIQAVLQFTDDVNTRLELTDIFVDQKNGAAAAEQLVAAANANQDFGPTGVANFGNISAKIEKLKQLGLLDADSEKTITKYLSEWKAQKTEQDKYEEEQRKQQAEEEKKFKEEQAKAAKEAAEKAKAEANKPKPAPEKGSGPLKK